MADKIKELPVVEDPPTPVEVNLMREIFQSSVPETELKSLFFYAVLFFVLNLKIVDSFLRNFITTSDILFLMIKTFIFIVIISLSRLMNIA